MHLCLFEDKSVPHLFPLALTRAAGDLRVGARTLIEAQEAAFPDFNGVILWTRPEVGEVTRQEHPGRLVNEMPEAGEGLLLVNQRWLVREGGLARRIRAAAGTGKPERAWKEGDALLAAWLPNPPADLFDRLSAEAVMKAIGEADSVQGEIVITRLWDLIDDVAARTARDLEAMGNLGSHAGQVQPGALLVRPEAIFLGRGSVVRPGAVLNAEDGPIHIAAGAIVEENAVGRGPLFLGGKSIIKAGARVDGSAVGPGCKVGGEVHESILHSYSSKAHDGYLGNSYVGRWCNMGADTNTSNLKNDYGEVGIYDAVAKDFLPSGRQFAGLFMGDHSKCSINTMFNTGTVVGVCCNLFGSGFPPRHVPDFTWGAADVPYQIDKALAVAQLVMNRRGIALTDSDRRLLRRISERRSSS